MRKYDAVKAPEAHDIIWQNWGYSHLELTVRRTLSDIGIYSLVIVNFFILLCTKMVQSKLAKSKYASSVLLSLLNVGFSVVVILVNRLLLSLINYFVVLEKHKTSSLYFSQILNRNLLANFVNTVSLVLIVNRIVGGVLDSCNVLGLSGTVGNVIVSGIIHTFSNSLTLILNPKYLWKLLQRNRLTIQLKNDKNRVIQCEVNEVFEQLPTHIHTFYNMTLTTVVLAYFTSRLFLWINFGSI